MRRNAIRTRLPASFGVLCAAAVSARAADPVRIGLKVLGESPVTAPLRSCLDSALSHHPGYLLVNRLPTVEIDVVTNTDVDDNINQAGVSLAIAYVDHGNAITLAKTLLGGAQPTTNPAVRAAVLALFASGGGLERLNVGHIGRPDARSVAAACNKIAETFFLKVPSPGRQA